MGDLTYLRKEIADNSKRRDEMVAFLERLIGAAKAGNVQGLFVMGYGDSTDPDVIMDLYSYVGMNSEPVPGNTYTLLGLVEANIQNVRQIAADFLASGE